ncbi:MAG: hypothetical protein J1F12_04480 [Muribaculaceae bacterium]|nr:hypothetical protein [Muribaculaceae bacterium]
MKKFFLLFIPLLCLLVSPSCGSDKPGSVLKEWKVKSSQDNGGSYEWEGTLYCTKDGINWKHATANDFLAKYLPGGNHWKVAKENFEFIGMGDTTLNEVNTVYIEIKTKDHKVHFIQAQPPEENKQLMNYLIKKYME